MFPPYKSRSTQLPSRIRGGALRCTKPRPRWPAPYRRVIYLRTIRKSAAVKFKFYLKTRSSPAPLFDSNPLVSSEIQSQLSEALSVIGQHDSARKGLALLREMVAQLQKLKKTNDYASINGLLASVNSLFIKFRDTFSTASNLFVDLKCCLDKFYKPLFELFKLTASLIDHAVDSGAAAANVPIIIPYIESQRLCCSIFYSLNFRELPEFCKDHMSEWMVEFKKYIKLSVPALEDGLALAELRAAVCENLSLYVIKEEELFHGYVIGFAVDVSNLLISSSSHGREQLSVTVSAIKFLTAVSRSSHHILLSKDVILHLIYKRILIPHLILHDVDEELFEINPLEFIRKDMEASDIDPIRRIACELLKGIATHYKDKVVEVLFLETARCFHRFSGDPKGNWKHIYCAFCLAISLATENAAGGTSISTDIVNVEYFFFDFIVKELRINKLDVTSFPMIQAVSLKFIILFRNQLSKKLNGSLVLLLPLVTRLLTSPHYVVHSYAAWCIEALFLVNDYSDWFQFYSCRVLWLARAGYTLSTVMSNLFGALNFPESEENLYVMKCITRVVLVGGDLTTDVASLCIEGLTTILHKVCQNPKNALFNHYLFESLTGLIRRVCFLSKEVNERPFKEEISLASLLERKLYPCLESILARDISELFTYAFRLLAELVDLNRPLLPAEYYSQVFDILHLPDTWMSQANVPVKHEINFPSVIYSKLVSSSAIKDQGYYVMNTVIENLGLKVMAPFISHIWVSLFNRLQNQRTVKSVKKIIVFMSLFLLKDSPKNFVSSINKAIQPNAFQAILEQFWIPNLKLITDPIELKLAIVASTRLICESPDIFDIRLWGKMLDGIITLVSRTVDDEPETMGVYNAVTFTPLYEARKKEEEDPLKGIKDPRQFLVVSLSNLVAASGQGRKYPLQVISESLERADQRALLQLFNWEAKIHLSALAFRGLVGRNVGVIRGQFFRGLVGRNVGVIRGQFLRLKAVEDSGLNLTIESNH